jgi:FHS family Na+ dependent glucose MFS transporter 1
MATIKILSNYDAFIAVGNTLILLIWGKENGPWMQCFHCLFSVGCLVAPVIAEPFLMETTNEVTNGTNYTADPTSAPPESQIMYAYLIAGVMTFVSGITFGCIFVFVDSKIFLKKKREEKDENRNATDPIDSIPQTLYHIFLSFLAVMYAAYCAVEVTFATYLLTFAVRYLHWSKKAAANVTSALMGAFTAGRGLGIVQVIFLRPSLMIFGDLTAMVVIMAVLCAFVTMHSAVLWACSIGFGFAMATFYGTGFTWTEQQIGTQARVSALILVASSIGEMSGPAMAAPLMGKVGYFSFVVVILTLCAVGLFCMIV